MTELNSIQKDRNHWIGKSITFRSPTRWSDCKAKRLIRSIDGIGRPCVKFGGWGDFAIHEHEVIDIDV